MEQETALLAACSPRGLRQVRAISAAMEQSGKKLYATTAVVMAFLIVLAMKLSSSLECRVSGPAAERFIASQSELMRATASLDVHRGKLRDSGETGHGGGDERHGEPPKQLPRTKDEGPAVVAEDHEDDEPFSDANGVVVYVPNTGLGLGDRLNGLVTAYWTSRFMQRPLRVCWENAALPFRKHYMVMSRSQCDELVRTRLALVREKKRTDFLYEHEGSNGPTLFVSCSGTDRRGNRGSECGNYRLPDDFDMEAARVTTSGGLKGALSYLLYKGIFRDVMRDMSQYETVVISLNRGITTSVWGEQEDTQQKAYLRSRFSSPWAAFGHALLDVFDMDEQIQRTDHKGHDLSCFHHRSLLTTSPLESYLACLSEPVLIFSDRMSTYTCSHEYFSGNCNEGTDEMQESVLRERAQDDPDVYAALLPSANAQDVRDWMRLATSCTSLFIPNSLFSMTAAATATAAAEKRGDATPPKVFVYATRRDYSKLVGAKPRPATETDTGSADDDADAFCRDFRRPFDPDTKWPFMPPTAPQEKSIHIGFP